MTYAESMYVYVCARGRRSARVSATRNRYRPVECLGEDWTRKQRLRWQDPPRGNDEQCGLAPSRVFPPQIRLVPSRSHVVGCVNERTQSCRRSTGALLLLLPASLSPPRPRINTLAGPYFRPRNLNFCTRSSVTLFLTFTYHPIVMICLCAFMSKRCRK